jgi:hypothetical protein
MTILFARLDLIYRRSAALLNRMRILKSAIGGLLCLIAGMGFETLSAGEIDLGTRRELFVDHYLIENLKGAELMLHEPRDEGSVLKFDQPWEGPFCGYCTVIRDGNRFLLYYRGKKLSSADGQDEATCVAESSDGVHWVKPGLGLHEAFGTRSNNIIWAENQFSHNFSPMLDANPKADPAQRFKALGGTSKSGLTAFVSPDGVQWKKLREQPVFTKEQVGTVHTFDSQNVAFWSEAEQRYVMYFRVYHQRTRRIARVESKDFVTWTNQMLMEYRGADGEAVEIEQLYTSQTHPYFRAPQLYVALAARFMLGRQVLTEEQAKAINIHPSYFKDTSDAVFMTTRGGNYYNRTFMSAFVRPGIGPQNWVSRTTYPALNVVQTGEHEMSAYVNQDYAQPTAHLRRYSMRLDGFASVRAPHEGGEMRTKLFTFSGARLFLNFATSAAGFIRVEVRDAAGNVVPGLSLGESPEMIGNEIEREVRWKSGKTLADYPGKEIQLQFVMKDADLYAMRFGE